MRRYGRPIKSKVMFHGMPLVRLHDRTVRECIRYWRDGSLTAIIQRNGNIAVNCTGIFDDETDVRAQYRVAQCLAGLKMVSKEFVEAHKVRADVKQRAFDIECLEADADRLGLKVVPA
jgi:hypothetical protein